MWLSLGLKMSYLNRLYLRKIKACDFDEIYPNDAFHWSKMEIDKYLDENKSFPTYEEIGD